MTQALRTGIMETLPQEIQPSTEQTHLEDTDRKQTKRQKSTSVVIDSCGSEDGISGSENIHRECLQENLQLMSDNMVLKHVMLLDELVENGCLTENETADILEFKNRKDQTRKLAVAIAKRSREKFMLFLKALKREENYPYIAKEMENSYKVKAEEYRKRECIQCYIVHNVDLRNIIDFLCSQSVVNLEYVNDVITYGTRNGDKLKSLWKQLFDKLNTSVDAIKYRRIFKKSLERKYDHIAKHILVKNQIKCRCNRIDKKIVRVENMSWPSGSVTTDERSTTSTVVRPNSHASTSSTCSSISDTSDVDNRGLTDRMSRTSKWVNSIQNTQSKFEISHTMEHHVGVCKFESDNTFQKQLKSEQIETVKQEQSKWKLNYKRHQEKIRQNRKQSEETTKERQMKVDRDIIRAISHSLSVDIPKVTCSCSMKPYRDTSSVETSEKPKTSITSLQTVLNLPKNRIFAKRGRKRKRKEKC